MKKIIILVSILLFVTGCGVPAKSVGSSSSGPGVELILPDTYARLQYRESDYVSFNILVDADRFEMKYQEIIWVGNVSVIDTYYWYSDGTFLIKTHTYSSSTGYTSPEEISATGNYVLTTKGRVKEKTYTRGGIIFKEVFDFDSTIDLGFTPTINYERYAERTPAYPPSADIVEYLTVSNIYIKDGSDAITTLNIIIEAVSHSVYKNNYFSLTTTYL
jgi:hypothetical protein